jgi:transcription antitermination protein NusB
MKDFDKKQIINRKRTLSRLVAAQILYQYEFFNRKRDIDIITDEIIDNYALFDDEKIKSYRKFIDSEFVDNLVLVANNNEEKINELIRGNSKDEQEIDRLSNQILKLGICEILFFDDIDNSISINEYCDVAGFFFDEAKISFISYVLNQINKDGDD